MNVTKVKAALKALTEAITESQVTDEEWIEFGQAVDEAVRDRYDVFSVVSSMTCNENWRPSARRVWKAAKPLGLHGITR
jgi:hypothetical protein